ncbi:MAG TPA: hypothetical protein VFU24_04490, partial [Burkholderiales bacterium]|nr:hypothetical protein [Burkholderiales bacterium]
MLSRLAKSLAQKRSFVRVSIWMFGIPFGGLMLWQFAQYGGLGWWLFIAAVSLLAGWAWGHGMWLVCKNDFQQGLSESPPTKAK